MRDPRYESAQARLTHDCVAGEDAELEVTRLPGSLGNARIVLHGLGMATPTEKLIPLNFSDDQHTARASLGQLTPGGYSAQIEIGQAPAARLDFACEAMGNAWSDTRPNVELLRRIAEATGGTFAHWDDVASLPSPPATQVASERSVEPLLPIWLWALLAGSSVGAHWLLRRRAGLA